MKKVMLVLATIFTILTFVGAIYVLVNHGTVNAGYAVVPMALAIACFSVYKSYKDKGNKQ